MDGTDICIYDTTGNDHYYFPPLWHTLEPYLLIACGVAITAFSVMAYITS